MTLWWSVEHRMKAATPRMRSLTLKPMPAVKNRWLDSWSVDPTTTWPSLRGRTGPTRENTGRPLGGADDRAGAVEARPRGGLLLDPRRDLHVDPYVGAGVGHVQRDVCPGDFQAERGDVRGDPVQAVGVVDCRRRYLLRVSKDGERIVGQESNAAAGRGRR